MTARSHLVATPTTDRNGKQTTVYRKPEGAGAATPALPPPAVAVSAPVEKTRAEAYVDRLAAVEADNAQWGRKHPKYYEVMEWASEGVGSLTLAAARGARGPAETLAQHVSFAFGDPEFSRVVMADVRRPVLRAAEHRQGGHRPVGH